MAKAAGAREVVPLPLINGAGFHLLGTARMGADRSTSVVDADCRAHDVENLFIVDGSVFATCGALNPTSTICRRELLPLGPAPWQITGSPRGYTRGLHRKDRDRRRSDHEFTNHGFPRC